MEKIAVHVTTKEQYNEVKDKMGLTYSLQPSDEDDLRIDLCISLLNSGYTDSCFYKGHGYTIITFEQWKAQYNPAPVPDFSIERYEKEVVQAGTHLVQQRCGLPVRQELTTDMLGEVKSIAGLMKTTKGCEVLGTWTKAGIYSRKGEAGPHDLVIVPKPLEPIIFELTPSGKAIVNPNDKTVRIENTVFTITKLQELCAITAAIADEPA